MLHPSYVELMKAVNEHSDSEEPVVTSRYSLVIAAAKRARQLIDNGYSEVEDFRKKKPLSTAVEELYNGDVKILAPLDDAEEEEEEEEEIRNKMHLGMGEFSGASREEKTGGNEEEDTQADENTQEPDSEDGSDLNEE